MNKNVEHSITQYLSGNLSDAERKDLELQIAVSADVRAIYDELRTIWELTNQLCYDQDAVEASWRSFEGEIVPLKKSVAQHVWMKVAASVALVACASVVMWFLGSTDVTFTSTDAVKTIELYDLSTITLNENSSLKLLSEEGDATREVELNGQARFKIMKNDKPFIVHTSDGLITVLGTEFDALSTASITSVELYEGKVSYITTAEQEIILSPNTRLIHLTDDAPTTQQINKPLIWQGSISCENMPLSYILEQLKLAYKVEVGVSGKLLKGTYTVDLPKDNLKACLHILNDVVGKNFALINGSIVLQ